MITVKPEENAARAKATNQERRIAGVKQYPRIVREQWEIFINEVLPDVLDEVGTAGLDNTDPERMAELWMVIAFQIAAEHHLKMRPRIPKQRPPKSDEEIFKSNAMRLARVAQYKHESDCNKHESGCNWTEAVAAADDKEREFKGGRIPKRTFEEARRLEPALWELLKTSPKMTKKYLEWYKPKTRK